MGKLIRLTVNSQHYCAMFQSGLNRIKWIVTTINMTIILILIPSTGTINLECYAFHYLSARLVLRCNPDVVIYNWMNNICLHI